MASDDVGMALDGVERASEGTPLDGVVPGAAVLSKGAVDDARDGSTSATNEGSTTTEPVTGASLPGVEALDTGSGESSSSG